METVSFDLAVSEPILTRNRTAIFRWDQRPHIHSEKLLVLQPMQAACCRISVEDIAFQILDEDSVWGVVKDRSEQALAFLNLVCIQFRLHERRS